MKTRMILYAEEGMVLTDGDVYGKEIYLADGKAYDDFYEISEAEYEKIAAEEAEKMEAIL